MKTKGDEDKRSMFVLLKSNGELSLQPIIAYVVRTMNLFVPPSPSGEDS